MENNLKEKFYASEARHSIGNECNHIKDIVTQLLEALLKPSREGFIFDRERLKMYFIDDKEPIDCDSMYCSHVSFYDSKYQVNIEEVLRFGRANAECPTLCDYVARYLRTMGWENVEVKTR